MALILYNKDNQKIFEVSPSDNSTLKHDLMGESVMNLTFSSPEYRELQVGDYAMFDGDKFLLAENYQPVQKSSLSYEYSPKLYGFEGYLKRVLMINLTDDAFDADFTLDGSALDHVTKLVDNLNRLGLSIKIGNVIDADQYKTIDYKGVMCSDAVKLIAEAFDTEWWFDGVYFNLTKCERDQRVELGYLSGLTSLSCSSNDNVRFFTRLIPLGSTRNIDRNKYNYKRLQLPDRAKYVERNTHYGLYEAQEESAFAHIYPRRIGTVSEVRVEDKTIEGVARKVYYFKDASLDFDPNKYELPGLVKNIVFQSGTLNGRDFECNYNSTTKEFEIINVYPTEDSQLPGSSMIPRIGDQYILYNITMPDEYYTLAENEYKTAVDAFIDKYSEDMSVYKASSDYIYFMENNLQLKVGSRIRLRSEQYFSGYRDTRIISISRKINNPYKVDIECASVVGQSKMENITSSVEELKRVVSDYMNPKYLEVIKSWDNTEASNYNVFSALRSIQQFINKRGDKVSGIIDFLSDIKVKGEADINNLVAVMGAIQTLTASDIDSDRAAIRSAVIDLLQSDNITAKLIRSTSYASGITGHGYSINNEGDAELKSLFIREFLEATEFRYNRVTVIAGESWRGSGAGLIKSVDTTARTITLKLEEAELASIDIDDICKGIYHTSTGFSTAFFKITEKVTEDTFKYALRSGYTMHPQMTMSFIAYGNFTNKSRQQSCYEARNYKRYLAKVNDWDIKLSNIMMQLGDLSNLKTEHGLDMTGYSAYLKNIYMTGTIKQLSADGVTEEPIPCFKGAWVTGTYYYYDEVAHIGCKWMCMVDQTTQEPGDSTDWLKTSDKGGKGDKGDSGASLRPRGEWKPNTRYVVDENYHDTTLYNGNNKIAKITHTSGATFDPSLWSDFNEFINVATQVLLANKGTIEVLGAGKLFVGALRDADGWEMTGGKIRHTKTGLELTADGKIKAPPGGITFSGGKTVEEVINGKIDDVQIGGVNLLPRNTQWKAVSNDGSWIVVTGNTYNNYPSYELSCSDGASTYSADISDKINQPGYYAISCYIKAISNSGDNCLLRVSINNIPICQGVMSELNKWYRVQGYAYVENVSNAKVNIDYNGYWNNVIVSGMNIEIGNKPTDWTPAPDDVQVDINNIQVGGRNLVKDSLINESSARYGFATRSVVLDRGVYVFSAKGLVNAAAPTENKELRIYLYNGDWSFQVPIQIQSTTASTRSALFNITAKGTYLISSYVYPSSPQVVNAAATVEWYKIEKGNKPTDWSPAPEDIDYLTDAMKGDTNINGGLVMSNVMAVRGGTSNTEDDIIAGMSGLKDDGVFFFADARNAYKKAINYFKGVSSDKPLFGVSKGGFLVAMSGLIGCFRIAKDLVTIQNASGEDKVKFTGESIEKFANNVPTVTGGTLGAMRTEYTNSTGAFRQYKSEIATMSYSFNLSYDTVFSINTKQNMLIEATATAAAISLDNMRVEAESYLNVSYRLEIKNNGIVILNQVIGADGISATTFDKDFMVVANKDVSINNTQSLSFAKGTVEAKLFARYDMQLYSYNGSGTLSSAYAKIDLKSGTTNALFTFVSTTDETIIGSDGLSIRMDSNNWIWFLKKAGELLFTFKGKVSPDSNIPALICGGEVNASGTSVYKAGGDSYPYRASTGYYRVALPEDMRGKGNYIVQLTGVETDNIVTMASRDTASNCFYVKTYNTPTVLENAGFSYMVYRAK